MKLKIKIAIIFVLLTLVPIISIAVQAIKQGKETIEAQMVNHLLAVNESKIKRFEGWIETTSFLLASINELTAIGNIWEPYLTKQSAHNLNSNIKSEALSRLRPFIRDHQMLELYVLEPNQGRIVLSTDPIQEGKFKDNQPYFLEGLEGLFVQTIVHDVVSQMPTMTMSIPIKARGGKTLGVLCGKVDLAALSAIMEERNQQIKTEDSYMVNKYNYFVTEPRFGDNYALRKSVYSKALSSAKESGEFIGYGYLDYRHEPVIGACRWMPNRELYLVTEVNLSEAYLPISQLRNKVILTAAALSAIAALIGWFSALTITKPLSQLIKATRLIGRGDLSFALNTKGKGEFQDLARAFDSMAKTLNQTMVSRDRLEKEVRVRKKTEKDLKKAIYDLENSNKDLQQFAYVASHDLQEPLRMVSSFTQLLSERYNDQLDGKAQQYIFYAVDGAVRMQKLIQDLLAFSRVSTHGTEFEMVDTEKVLKTVLTDLKMNIDERNAQINYDNLPRVKADPNQLSQLFQNLISNAMKFCPQKPPEIRISSNKTDEEYIFSVSDNGIGINSEYKKKVFIIFQRLHTRKEYPGTGIGLAVCKRIVNRHGGRIWFESDPDNGSTFYFSLPA